MLLKISRELKHDKKSTKLYGLLKDKCHNLDLELALHSRVHCQQYFGGAFIGNHVHKALKLANIQTLCKSLAQTALNKLPNRSTEAKHRSEMLVNAFSMFAQCHIYELNFIDEAQTHALEQSIEQFMKFFRESFPETTVPYQNACTGGSCHPMGQFNPRWVWPPR
ncbi:hypothetical protein EMCRGX_G020482 [Ephydatia muelleri]